MKTHNWIALCLAAFFAVHMLAAGAAELGKAPISNRAIKETEKAYGPEAADRIAAWNSLVMDNKNKPIAEKLALTNEFFNRIPVKTEEEIWGRKHWSTPFEMLQRNAGSQADHVIAKYVTLEALGIGIEKMKITHVHSMKSADQSYMVLTYQSEPGVMPLVLDTMDKTIKPANERIELFPEHSLNADGLWLSKEQKDGRNDAKEEADAQVELWNEMNARMGKEQLSNETPMPMK